MSNLNPHTTTPVWQRQCVMPVDYCKGFMAGLKQELDDQTMITMLDPVFGTHQNQAQLDKASADTALFMRGLYDGLKEHQRITANPTLYRNWLSYLSKVQDCILVCHEVRREA